MTNSHLLLFSLCLFSPIWTHEVSHGRGKNHPNKKWSDKQREDFFEDLTNEDIIALAIEKYIVDFPEKKEEVLASRKAANGETLVESGTCDSDGPTYHKIGHDYTLNLDHFKLLNATQNCETPLPVLCMDEFSYMNRAPYFVYAPDYEYAWSEHFVAAILQRFSGCELRFNNGIYLCNYFFGYGWTWASTNQGRIVPGMWGTSFSGPTWPDNSPGNPKVNVNGNFRVYGNLYTGEYNEFWMNATDMIGCA